MPADKKQRKAGKTVGFEYCDKNSETGPPNDEAPTLQNKKMTPPENKKMKRKQISEERVEEESDTEKTVNTASNENEMSSLLSAFGTDVTKTMSAKRKRLAGFTSTAMKTSNKRYEDIFSQQQMDREKISGEFVKQVSSVFTQWENDVQKSKDTEEKIESIIRQVQRTSQTQRVTHNQRLTSLRKLHEEYTKAIGGMEKMHKDQQTDIQGELRKELSGLREKMMEDTKKEEMINMRKSLQTMLSSV